MTRCLIATLASCTLASVAAAEFCPGPMHVKLDAAPKAGAYALSSDKGAAIPAQADADGNLWWWAAQPVPENGYKLQPVTSPTDKGVTVEKTGEGTVAVTIDGKPFTTFNFKPDDPKPYLWPVIGPTGVGVTRDFPMKDHEPKPEKDHPHHRSIWTAHGDVRLGDVEKRGTDYWAQGEGKGLQKVRKITRTVNGPVFGLLEAEIDWVTQDGKRELSETRTYRFFRGDKDNRVIDVQVVFHFPEGDVMFADTKEGGIVSVRVAPTMDEKSGGKMVNSEGHTGMKQCWGKPAAWCDYVGQVDGKTLGIAVFDAPSNFRHPTRWHIRDYGLYTANPFGLKDFTGDKTQNGSHTWKKGENPAFNYRIVVHTGDTQAADVPCAYKLFASPPKVAISR